MSLQPQTPAVALATASRSRLLSAAGLTPALRSAWRGPVAVALAVAAGAHVPVIGEHLREAPYMGVLFVLLTAACLICAVGAFAWDPRALYGFGGTVCALAILGYCATRLVAFPQLDDDLGNWLEPLGVVSVASELVAVACAVAALAGDRHRR
jgi:hypothetical protein